MTLKQTLALPSQTTFNVEKQNKLVIKSFPIMFFEDMLPYRFLFFLEIDNALVFIINATSFMTCVARAPESRQHTIDAIRQALPGLSLKKSVLFPKT